MTRDELKRAVDSLPADASITLRVEQLRAALDGSDTHAPAPTGETPERWLSADDVARRIGASRRYVYAHRREFPFAKQLPGGKIRFSEKGLLKWMDRRTLSG